MSTIPDNNNYIYIYDLPKTDINSTKLAMAFEQQAGVSLVDGKPQIRRDITRPFYSGIVQIKDPVKFNEAAEKMKYFLIDGKMCRALKFDKSLLGSNKEKLQNHNVFVKSIPKEMTHSQLEEKFRSYGKIKSLKVSLNGDHSSRGYGFICFEEAASAVKAIEGSAADPDSQSIKFEPKDRRSLISLINNVYVKNIPLDFSDEAVKQMFAPYGNIKSLVLQKNDIGQFGFVCFDDVEGVDKEYGPRCAQAAIQELNGKEMSEGVKLYVRTAMKKSDRESEKMKETLRYKTSKKRCNLYVKNFPVEWGENELKGLFDQFGVIEKIRVEKKGKAGNAFAFVCFKTPDSAAAAKQNLHNHTIDGKALMINHYEIKQLRDLQIEEAIDKSDFEKYQAQKNGGFHLNDLISHPHMTQILQQLLEIMQQNEAMNAHFQQTEQKMHRGNYQNRGHQQNKPYHNGPRQHQGGNNMHQGNMMNNMGQNMPGMHQRGGMPQQPGMPQMPQAQQPGMPMTNMGGMPGLPGQNVPQAQMTPDQKYQTITQKLLPSVTERNPYLKDQVGQAIFEFVNMMVPPERAPKITGMLIELPVDQIKAFMGNLNSLRAKVSEATDLIDHAEKQGLQTQIQ